MSRLREAHALIADEKHWTQRMYAADANGHVVSLRDKPTRYCAVGAILAAWGLDDFNYPTQRQSADLKALTDAARALFPATSRAVPRNPLLCVNDELGHEAVMQVYEKAIVEEYGSL